MFLSNLLYMLVSQLLSLFIDFLLQALQGGVAT